MSTSEYHTLWMVFMTELDYIDFIDGLVQDCSNSIDNAMELLQSCAKPSIYQLKSY